MGFGCLFWFVVGLSVSFSPPSDCISFPSMMTWAPCPHGIRTRGKTLRFWRLVLGPSMDKIFARVVIRLAASHCS